MADNLNINRNNLDKSTSPYLKQHANNPIHWQEWSRETLDAANDLGRPVLVSIGYYTCHWCHVMAHEAFSNQEIADFLNSNFISIKVDREQRPDIDQYYMTFIQNTVGRGGWPLNVFLSPQALPIIAFTYMPVESRFSIPPMMDILRAVLSRGKGIEFKYSYDYGKAPVTTLDTLVSEIVSAFDSDYGGLGEGNKFPPSSTMLFLLSYYENNKDDRIREVLTKTLDAMMNGGLYDHLQGGFFRYCVDRKWTIPHFEKMLYDQAMLLWVYSWAFSVFRDEAYQRVVLGIIRCLDETFLSEGLFVSAHDADTGHDEGATYVWKLDELESVLETAEFTYLRENYDISAEGNFEGAHHLVRKTRGNGGPVEEKLLEIRKKREQPFVDRKSITSWNALTGIAFIMAYRATQQDDLLDKANTIFHSLLERHFIDGKLAHSSLDGLLQEQEFLEDTSALLLLATYLFEDRRIDKYLLLKLRSKLQEFQEEDWLESKNSDFIKVSASRYDHPSPSSYSLAEMGLLRCRVLLNEAYAIVPYRKYPGSEFYQIMLMINEGQWHFIHTPEKVPWKNLPLNSIQIEDSVYSDCFQGECRRLEGI